MLYCGAKAQSPEQGKACAHELIRSGDALAKFGELIKLQGGDARVIDNTSLLAHARHTAEVCSPTKGFVTKIDCRAVGIASVVLGGGRNKKEDAIDPSVGIVVHRKIGDAVRAAEPLCTIHYNSETRAAEAAALLLKSFEIADAPPAKATPLIHRVMGA
jgi:pyrimidine-nucleoside phosphorylase